LTTKDIGDIGEEIACQYLKKDKYKIAARNCHFSHNEIDIVAEDKNYVVFVEVKTRSVDTNYHFPLYSPASAVTRSKQIRLIEAAYAYIKQNNTQKQPRMDVIEVWLDKKTKEVIKINHIRNAYGR